MTRERNTASRDTPRWFPRSLRRQLLIGVLAVVSVVLVAVGVVSVLSLRGYVTTMNDAEVAKSLHAFNNSYTDTATANILRHMPAPRRCRRRSWSSPDKPRETSSPCCTTAP